MPYILICRYSCTVVHEGLKKYNMCDIHTYVPYGSNEGRLGVKKRRIGGQTAQRQVGCSRSFIITILAELQFLERTGGSEKVE